MSKRETVLVALHGLLAGAGLQVLRNDVLPNAIPVAGLLVLHDGVPGAPEVTLSPPVWHYQHRAQLDVFIEAKEARDTKFDALLSAVGVLISADRTLGGLCDWVEAEAPEPSDLPFDGATGIKAAALTVVLHYSTTDPLN